MVAIFLRTFRILPSFIWQLLTFNWAIKKCYNVQEFMLRKSYNSSKDEKPWQQKDTEYKFTGLKNIKLCQISAKSFTIVFLTVVTHCITHLTVIFTRTYYSNVSCISFLVFIWPGSNFMEKLFWNHHLNEKNMVALHMQ